MTIVVVDTNLICRNPDFSGATWSEIIRHIEARDIRVILPDVVIQEVAAKIRATASAATVQAARRPLRCCPDKTTRLVKAIGVLQDRELQVAAAG